MFFAYSVIFILVFYINFITFAQSAGGDEPENPAKITQQIVDEADEFFKGFVHEAKAGEMVVDLFCAHDKSVKVDLYTKENGQFFTKMSRQIMQNLRHCQWVTVGFYKKNIKPGQSCWNFLKNNDKMLRCYVVMDVKWLKFGGGTTTVESIIDQLNAAGADQNLDNAAKSRLGMVRSLSGNARSFFGSVSARFGSGKFHPNARSSFGNAKSEFGSARSSFSVGAGSSSIGSSKFGSAKSNLDERKHSFEISKDAFGSARYHLDEKNFKNVNNDDDDLYHNKQFDNEFRVDFDNKSAVINGKLIGCEDNRNYQLYRDYFENDNAE